MTSPAPFPYGITVKVQRPTGAADRYGQVTYADHHDLDGCALAPRYSTEDTDNRTSVIVGFSLFGPPQTGDDRVFAKDRIKTPDGNVYRVIGESAEWANPLTGLRFGFEAALERVT
jgi:hypothetical protein